ncbi:unnamed protein product [Merluccius merluccius]
MGPAQTFLAYSQCFVPGPQPTITGCPAPDHVFPIPAPELTLFRLTLFSPLTGSVVSRNSAAAKEQEELGQPAR